jgi:hypothetical protein
MKVSDLTVEVRNSLLERVAQITEEDLVGFTVVLRFNNVGSWKAVLPADSIAAEALRQPGAGVIVTGPEGVIFTGPTTSAKKIQTSEDPEGLWEIEGVDDSVLLLERLAYPDPTEPDAGLQTVAYDEITDQASAVLYYYVDANMGPSAPTERQIPNLTVATDTGLGSTITGKLRFDVLGLAFTKLVAPDGLGFDIKQQDGELVFAVYEPVDRSGDIRLDVENNRLSSSEYTYQNPRATRAIVAGQGQGADREILEVATAESENSETAWGRRIEVFTDRRDGQETELLEQTGIELLAKDGKTLEGISVKPSDDGLMRYGYDWNLGDKVSVVANQAVAVATVTEVALSVTESGVYILATVGEPDTVSDESRVASVQSNQEDRISNLERHGQAGGGGGGGGGGGSIGYYGSFYDMTDQPLLSITAAQPIAIGVTAEANGVNISSGNRITFPNAGTYSMTFSIQITNYANAIAKAVFWVKKNGVDYADSATELDLPARKSTLVPNRQVLTINYVATAASGDYVQVFWAGDNLDLKVESLPAGTSPVYPAVPSIILTATQVGNSGLHVSPSAPLSTGVLWLDTDEESDIPVPIGGTAGQALVKIDSTNYNTTWADLNSTHNHVINGAFDIWQRGTTFSGAVFTADRWATTISSQSASRSTDAPEGFEYSIDLVRNTGTVNPLRTRIESSDAKALVGKTVTLSFWAKNIGSPVSLSSQMWFPTVKDNFTSVTSIEQKLIANPMSTSWTRYYVTFSNLPSGVINGLEIQIFGSTLGLGTSYNHRITGVQLEEGFTATSFRRNAPSIQAELATCQRYYYRRVRVGGNAYTLNLGFYNSATQLLIGHIHPVEMRIPPELSFSAVSDFDIEPFDVAPTSIAASGGNSTYASEINVTDPTARTTGQAGTIAIDTAGGWLAFEAEL